MPVAVNMEPAAVPVAGAKKAIDDRARRKTDLILTALVTVLLLLPFIDKAFHIDDPLFLWSAQKIQLNPWNPGYGTVNWFGTPLALNQVMRNPPLSSYYIAFVGSIFGWGERTLHLAFLLPAVICALGIYQLARLFCREPVVASLAAVCSPLFLVSATTIMCDITLMAFGVWALERWISGIREGKGSFLIFSTILITAAVFTKYTGITIIPLLLLYTLLSRRGIGRWIIYLLIPLVLLGLYFLFIAKFAPGDSLWGMIRASTAGGEGEQVFDFQRALTGVVFLGGGCFGCSLFLLVYLSRRARRIVAAIVSIAAIVVFGFGAPAEIILQHFHITEPIIMFQILLFTLVGGALLWLIVSDLLHCRWDADSILLAVYTVGVLGFAAFVSWSVSGRYLLPLVPAVGILTARYFERLPRSRNRLSLVPLLPAAILALLVTWADYAFANSARDAAERIASQYTRLHPHVWFEGHWGFQYYMEARGAKPLDMNLLRLEDGDLLVIPSNNTNRFLIDRPSLHAYGVIEVPALSWVTTMNQAAYAGFYSHILGPLPYVFGVIPTEKYYILIMQAPRAG